MGLDKPLYEQYVIYLGQLSRFRSRQERHHNRPVIEELGRRFPATIELTVAALIALRSVWVFRSAEMAARLPAALA